MCWCCCRCCCCRRCCCCAGKKQLVRNSKDAFIIVLPFIFWALMVILAYALTVIKLTAVSGLPAGLQQPLFALRCPL
jgi:hypothetical protein